jgi:hypothetical protein
MNSALDLHAACHAATPKVVGRQSSRFSHVAAGFRPAIGLLSAVIGADGRPIGGCPLFAQVKLMQIALFLCNRWGESIRSSISGHRQTQADIAVAHGMTVPPAW